MSNQNVLRRHHLISRIPVLFVCLAWMLPGAEGQFVIRSITGGVDTVSNPPAKTADAAYPFNTGISAAADVTFYKNTSFYNGQQVTAEMRVGFQLMDSGGTPVALASGGTVVYDDDWEGDSDVGFPITIGAFSSQRTESFSETIFPADQLDPNETYAIRAAVYWLDTSGFIPVWRTDDSLDSASQNIIHFTGDASGDLPLNVLSILNSVTFSNRSALVGSNPSAEAHAFELTANTTLHRFDDWDAPRGENPIDVVYDVELWRRDSTNGNEQIPLVQSRIVINEPVYNHNEGFFGEIPYEETVDHTLPIVADGVQLDSVNEEYYVVVSVTHEEVPAFNIEWAYGDAAESADTRLMHFNGDLAWAGFDTTLIEFTNDPAASASWSSGYVEASLSNAEGFLTGSPGYTWGPTPPTIRLYADGSATAVTGSSAAAVSSPSTPDMDDANGIRFKRSDLALRHTSGLTGTLTVYLPTGMGWAPTSSQHAYNGQIAFSGEGFAQDLQPANASYHFSTGGNFWVMEESKPLAYEVGGISWTVSTGLVEAIGTNQLVYVREDEMAMLEAAFIDPEEKVKRSNELYYRDIDALVSSNVIEVVPGPSGDARLSTDFSFNAGSFRAHFPYDVEIDHSGGYAVLVDDAFDSANSSLTANGGVELAYDQNCGELGCGGGLPPQLMRVGSNSGRYDFTMDGGLVMQGLIDSTSTPDNLAWGYIPTLSAFHHQTDPFVLSDFHMPGHFIRGDEDTGPGKVHGPGVILYSGFRATDLTVKERPGTVAYKDGLADYAGLNFRTGTDNALYSKSTIAGQNVTFGLTGRSKYYIRLAGVTGIHEASPGTFPNALTLNGYEFSFKQYGLNYRMSIPDESRTEGSIYLPYPSDFEQAFEELRFTCVGGLDGFKIPPGAGDQIMRYWLANITIHNMGFESEVACDPTSETVLLAGVSAEAAYVDVPLYGTLGYKTTGELIVATDFPTDVNSRLHLPPVVNFAGPAKLTDPNDPAQSSTEIYQLVPATLAYYNDYASTNEQGEGEGRINFAGTLDVAFFEDLQVHMQTSARNVLSTQSIPIRLMGGWNDTGDTFFNSSDFDSGNTGFPGGGVPEALYRNDPGVAGDPSPYLIHARQDWLGVINFDYPLTWSSSTRSFESYQPKENDLLVISAEHKVDYLSAETAELSIGITYEGMPEVNLTNFVINQVDEQTGVYQAILIEAKKPIVDSIESGIDKMAEMVSDRMDSFHSQLLGNIEDDIVDPMVDDLFAKADLGTYDPATISPFIQNYISGPSDSVEDMLGKMADDVNGVIYIYEEIDGRLAEIEYAIAAVIDEINVDSLGNVVPSGSVDVEETFTGLLSKNLQGDFQILTPFVERLLAELAPDVNDELNALLSGAVDDLNARINTLFEEVKPSIDQIVVILSDLRQVVADIRTAIEPGGEMLDEIRTIIHTARQANGEINDAGDEIVANIQAYLDSIPTSDQLTAHTKEEVKSRILNEIEDIFFGMEIVAEIQVTLKQYLYDVDAAINEAISSAFAQVNKVVRDLVSDALSEVDDTINGFLGDISAVMGAGKLNGYAAFNGDALRRLHIDLYLQLKVPDEMEFNGYLTIEQMDSEGDDSCSPGVPGGPVTEVTAGAIDVPADWISPDLRLSVEGKFNFQSDPSFKLLGMGGSLEMTSGQINFETFKITDMGAALMFGATENYLAAKLGLAFNSYEAFGGVFFGQTCTIDPLVLVDEDVESVIGQPNPTFTGAYVYGECHIPVSEAALGIPATCFFRISAGIGAGAFYFVEGNTLGGKIYASASGEALCVVSIKGEVTLIGAVSNGELNFQGTGRISGKAGACPFCIKFGKSATITYNSGSWGVDL